MFVFFLFSLALGQISGTPVTVVAPIGVIVGVRDDLATSFLGIPFAEPPVANLRWAEPVPKRPWNNSPLDATKWGPGCPQTCQLPPLVCPADTSEDCLQLNVFVPNDNANKQLLPVVVFLPGAVFFLFHRSLSNEFFSFFV